MDIASVDWQRYQVLIHLGKPTGGFDFPIHYATSYRPASVVFTYMNGDGLKDMVASGIPGPANFAHVSVLYGKGGGVFGTPIFYPLANATRVITGDFNSDGKQDIITTGSQPSFGLMLGTCPSSQPYATVSGRTVK